MNRSKLILSAGLLKSAVAGQVRAGRRAPIKQCLTCGAMHQHNNGFCSADCCKAYKARKRSAS